MTYDDTKSQLLGIISKFETEEGKACELRRSLRRTECDLEQLRKNGTLGSDETFIPQRIIDRRIKEELPNQVRMITQAQRLLVLRSKTGLNPVNMEKAFTNAMKYPGWEIPWIRLFDAVSLHGGAPVEVVFDPTMPGACRIEYIRREDFLFPVETRSLHLCEMVARRYVYPVHMFDSFIKNYNFNSKVVNEIISDRKSPTWRDENKSVYKVYRRTESGEIEVFWFAQEGSTYLRAPEPLTMGIIDLQLFQLGIIQPKPLRQFPIFWMPYEVIEDDRLLASKGRAFRDAPDQEALTQLWTSLVNASIKASGVFGSLENSFDASGLALNETTKLEKGKIHPSKVNFFSVQFPTGDLLMTALRYGIVSASTSGRIDVAVANRPDSRKTAREISEITELQTQINNMSSMSQLSVILKVYELCFDIYRSSIVYNIPPNLTPEEVFEEYEVQHSGSFELLEREQHKSNVIAMLPYLGQTPLAPVLLQYLVEQYFPDKAKEWVAVLQDNSPVALLSAVLPILQAVAPMVPADSKQQLTMLINEIATYLQGRGQAPVLPVAESSNDTAPQGGAVQVVQ